MSSPILNPTPRQSRRSLLFLASGAALGLLVAGFGLFTARGAQPHSVPPEDMALVNNRPILRSDFVTQVQTQSGKPFAQSTVQQRAGVLQDMLLEELEVQRGLEIDLPGFDPNVRAAMVAGVELEAFADVLAQQPGEEQLKAYFGAHQDNYASEGMLRLRDLVIRTTDALPATLAMRSAAQAVAQLRQGSNVEQLATRFHLEDSGRLIQDGRPDTAQMFEFAVRAKLGPQLFAVASALDPGQISEPTLQGDGAHVVVMLERRRSVPREYGSVADRVWSDYRSEQQQTVRAAMTRYLRQRAQIRLSPDAQQLAGVDK